MSRSLNKIAQGATVVATILAALTIAIFADRSKPKEANFSQPGRYVSDCLKALERVNASVMQETQWEAVEISELNGEPVSISNLKVKNFQEIAKMQKSTQANIGPFIMEKNLEPGGDFISETNPELLECGQDRIIISIWQ